VRAAATLAPGDEVDVRLAAGGFSGTVREVRE
jgi:preprotein translocase subunit YajC